MRPDPQPARPARPAPDPRAAARAGRLALIFGGLVLVTFVLESARLPWRMLSVATGLAAVGYGLVTLRATWRAGVRGLMIVAVSAATAMTALVVLSTGALVFVWQIELDRQECEQGAITQHAVQECRQSYEQALEDWRTSVEERARSAP